MKYSIAVAPYAPEEYPTIYKKDILNVVSKAREFGYTGIEWHLREPDFKDIYDVEGCCEASGMSITSIGTGLGCVIDGLTLMHADSDVRMQAVARLCKFIDMGAVLNSLVIIGSMKGKVPAGEEHTKYENYCMENLKAVMEYAESKGVSVVLEVLNRYETNLLNTIEQMNGFICKIDSKLLKTHIDTFHMNIEETDICGSIRDCGDLLGHVHFADSNRWHPGAGHIDFKPVLNALESVCYTGCIAMECLPYPEPDTAAKETIEYLNSL